MRRNVIAISTMLLASTLSSSSAAEDGTGQQGGVLIPSRLELTDEQKQDLQTILNKKLTAAVNSCVGNLPRPEFFTSLSVRFELRKSGDLRGGYISGGAVDSNMYVASDEEMEKRKEDGSLARIVVRNDRDLDRCLNRETREFDTEFSRYSARIEATYAVVWNGKDPGLTATNFEITKTN